MSLYEANRDIIPKEYNFSKQHIRDYQWDWLMRTEAGMYPAGLMRAGALSFGFIHAWFWQQLIFQWTPSMCKLHRS